MYLTLTDETNRDVGDSAFFLVGGVAVPFASAEQIHTRIDSIRSSNGYLPADSFKYARASKPPHVSEDQFNSAKSQALDLCLEFGAKVFLYVCHHLIAENRTPVEKFQWGSNGMLWQLNGFLNEHGTYSWVLQDRHPVEGEFQYYKQRFTESRPSFPNHYHKLNRIIGFGSTCDGASHLSSLADIVLGSYRFCINNPTKDIVNGILLPRLLRATYGFPHCIGGGIAIYPTGEIHKQECKAAYGELCSHIKAYTDTAQADA